MECLNAAYTVQTTLQYYLFLNISIDAIILPLKSIYPVSCISIIVVKDNWDGIYNQLDQNIQNKKLLL